VSTLLEEQPEVIAIHGRTLAQMYRGRADWDAIRRAAKLVRETPTLVLGNGDVVTMPQVVQRVRETQVHGVLIGRGALGNPWIFRAKAWARQQLSTPTAEAPSLDVAVRERCQVALEHARYFEGLHDGVPFQAMRKHLGWYCRGFPGAADMRHNCSRRPPPETLHGCSPPSRGRGVQPGEHAMRRAGHRDVCWP